MDGDVSRGAGAISVGAIHWTELRAALSGIQKQLQIRNIVNLPTKIRERMTIGIIRGAPNCIACVADMFGTENPKVCRINVRNAAMHVGTSIGFTNIFAFAADTNGETVWKIPSAVPRVIPKNGEYVR